MLVRLKRGSYSKLRTGSNIPIHYAIGDKLEISEHTYMQFQDRFEPLNKQGKPIYQPTEKLSNKTFDVRIKKKLVKHALDVSDPAKRRVQKYMCNYSIEDLLNLRNDDVIDILDNIIDPTLLKDWLKFEKRSSVKDAIKRQLNLIRASVEAKKELDG